MSNPYYYQVEFQLKLNLLDLLKISATALNIEVNSDLIWNDSSNFLGG